MITRPLAGIGAVYISLRDNLPGGQAALDRMPYAAKVFAENLLRHDGSLDDLEALVERRHDVEFPFSPGRVVLQDLTGTPALVDLAGLRNAVADKGGDPHSVNPRVPTHFVIDHSLKVVVDGSHADGLERNRTAEDAQNAERFEFLSWCGAAFDNLEVLPRGSGILHQINLERLSPLVALEDSLAFPDSLVGTDSHTPMINALGVLGWGVGGIEAESVMLGRPIVSPLPEIVGVELRGRLAPRIGATDLALALTEFLRREGVVGSILEFRGEGVGRLALADRATVSNMAPEYGATAALFPIDGRTLEFLALTGRDERRLALVEAYAKAQGLWHDGLAEALYDRRLHFDLGSVRRSIAGPANPHDRIELGELAKRGIAPKGARGASSTADARDILPGDGALVIAAITSCTNTANPHSLIAAGLLARNARRFGLSSKPWVKTSFTPGSPAVRDYLDAAGLLDPLAKLGFGIVGYACGTCNGMSGDLPPAIAAEIARRNLRATAILSGNRNFNGRIHPLVSQSFLASPALVVAWAIAGTMGLDTAVDALCQDPSGRPVSLDELWPGDEEIDDFLARFVKPESFLSRGGGEAVAKSKKGADGAAPIFPWNESSSYIRRPPYWDEELLHPASFRDMRALAILGDNVTTDDLSPSGAILPDSAAGRWLLGRGVAREDFNSYGTRRGDHLVAVRATLANNRLENEMAGGKEGSWTRLEPEGALMSLFDAGEIQRERGIELIIIAGKNYGAGSSRDWAAKGVRLLGVRAVVAEGFERIHRSNLIGMGILPLQFSEGATRRSLGLDGNELFAIAGAAGAPTPRSRLVLEVRRRDGSLAEAELLCRIDSAEEGRIYAAGGILPLVREELLAMGGIR